MFKKKGLMEIREVGKIGYADLCLGIVVYMLTRPMMI